jgi:hypothetical protein
LCRAAEVVRRRTLPPPQLSGHARRAGAVDDQAGDLLRAAAALDACLLRVDAEPLVRNDAADRAVQFADIASAAPLA